MKRNRDRHRRQRLRRMAAMILFTATAWGVAATSDTAAALEAVRALGESPAFVTGVLRAELGRAGEGDGLLEEMGAWQQAVLSQSLLLRSGEEAVSAFLSETEGEDGEDAQSASAPEAPEETPAVTTAPDDIIERTLTAHDGGNYASAEDIHINNLTGKTLDVAALAAAELDITLGEGPQILIMHTHGSEAYTPDGTDIYTATDTSRTTDEQYNMIRIGEEMKAVFESFGLEVVHDTSLYDYPSYTGSYDRSLAGVKDYLERYPTIRLVLDVHRDALIAEDGTTYKAVATVDGQKVAQVMMVMGSDDGGLNHPRWQENLSLAVHIQRELLSISPELPRPITLRSSRFNQQMTNGSLLVEVGCNGNTLQEAIAGAKLYAQAASRVFLTLK